MKRLPLVRFHNKLLMRNFFEEMPFYGESDKLPLDPDYKPQTGLSFFFNLDISPGKGKNTSYLK